MAFRAILAALLIAQSPVAALAADTVTTTVRTEADASRTMVHEVVVAAPIADVWATIATPEGWMTWAVPLARLSTTDPEVMETSYDRAAPPGGDATIQQRFVARIPGRLIAFRTIKAPKGFPHWEAYRGVTSLFELEPAGSGTRVRLTSTGYPDNDAGSALIGFFRTGNAETLSQLQARFVSGPKRWDGPATR